MIKITKDTYKAFTFSGGERHVELPNHYEYINENVVIKIDITSSDDIMDLLMLKNILDIQCRVKSVCLEMRYIPYARQDRATTRTTGQSLKVFAGIINSCNFKNVYVLDPHSIVAENLINNMIEFPVESYVSHFIESVIPSDVKGEGIVFLSPDLGALKKVAKYGKYFGLPPENIISANKIRDPATGEITKIEIQNKSSNFIYKHVIIIDDICDGGGTFIQLSKSIPDIDWIKSLNLFVTHGIFSKGLKPLFDAGFNNIGCTDSFPTKYVEEDLKHKLKIIKGDAM